jgi:HD-GYP domain-containing protein (c-di-GMP phosphodiesterase class II)
MVGGLPVSGGFMSSTIAVEELRVGMFIHLDGGWLSHPFPLSSFRIASAEQIQTLRGLGLASVRWSPDKSDQPMSAEEIAAAAAEVQRLAAQDAEERLHRQRREQLSAQREAAQRCERQHAEAAKAWREATDGVGAQPREAGRTTEALTRAMLSKMLVSQEIGIRLINGGGDRAAAHALNTSIVALLMGRSLGLSEPELVDLGTGALMHDVGKLDVPDRFRHLEEGFGNNELNAYRDHVAKGVTLGQRMGLAAGSLMVLAQHHEQADGSGFPLRLAGERISMGARIVAIVNRYDNLCNPQSRVIPLTPHEAVSVLFAQGRNRFDATVLNAFIRMMGVYPAGSLVQLTDDRFAMVMGVNSNRPLKPRVLVHDPRVPRSEALILDLEQQPDLGIRRSLVAAKLPPQAIDYLDPRPRVSYYFEPLEHGPHDAVLA